MDPAAGPVMSGLGLGVIVALVLLIAAYAGPRGATAPVNGTTSVVGAGVNSAMG